MGTAAKLAVTGIVVAAATGIWWVERTASSAPSPAAANRAIDVAAIDPAVTTSDQAPSITADGETADAAAERSLEKPPAVDSTEAARDLLAAWRKDGRFHGVVIDPVTGAPISGAGVRASMPIELFGLPAADHTTTGADGEFTFERLGDEVRIYVRADGFVRFDSTYGGDLLHRSAGSAPIEVELEPRHCGTLVVRLVPVSLVQSRWRPLSPRLLRETRLTLTPALPGLDQLDRFPELRPGGTLRNIAPTGEGVFRCEKVPTNTLIHVNALLDSFLVGDWEIGSLEGDETREITLPVESPIVATLRPVDALTGEPIEMAGQLSEGESVWRWSDGINPPITRRIAAHGLDGPIALPGPGHFTLDVRVRGFAPTSIEAGVEDGSIIDVPLEPLRQVTVRVMTPDGRGLSTRRYDDRSEIATTIPQLVLPDEDVIVTGISVADGELLPERFGIAEATDRDPTGRVDGNRLDHADVVAGGSRFDPISAWLTLCMPATPELVGVYIDGALAGSAHIRADQSIATVIVAPPALKFGALRFRALDAATDQLLPGYHVELTRLVGPEAAEAPTTASFNVFDAEHAEFACKGLVAGRYRLGIQCWRSDWTSVPSLPRLSLWNGTIDVAPGDATNLGVIRVPLAAQLGVVVIDEDGKPIPDAEIDVHGADGGRELPVVATALVGLIRTRWTGKTPPIKVGCGTLTVEARAPGFEPTRVIVDAPAGQTVDCTIKLRRARSPR